mgnify:CR=1 FL=1
MRERNTCLRATARPKSRGWVLSASRPSHHRATVGASRRRTAGPRLPSLRVLALPAGFPFSLSVPSALCSMCALSVLCSLRIPSAFCSLLPLSYFLQPAVSPQPQSLGSGHFSFLALSTLLFLKAALLLLNFLLSSASSSRSSPLSIERAAHLKAAVIQPVSYVSCV